MNPFNVLPELVTVTCKSCNGEKFFEPLDPDDLPTGCMACDSTGEVEICSGCGATPSVINGVEWCHCLEVAKAA